MKMSRMNTLRSPAAGDDTVELIHEDGGLGVEYRRRQCCGGSKKRAVLIILIVSLLVVGALATWTYFLVRSKFEACAVKCFIHQILVMFQACVTDEYLFKHGFIRRTSGHVKALPAIYHVSIHDHLLSRRSLPRV